MRKVRRWFNLEVRVSDTPVRLVGSRLSDVVPTPEELEATEAMLEETRRLTARTADPTRSGQRRTGTPWR